ncbi:protein SCARECROW 2-like [Triticum dicoccoides]|uniref:protein SCARECROW 2-like n=1 Tax=Triticum dicoccoides TaxID=85692 RepID=UPI0018901345|nr:protein SCARECROW 2-like [Triticum dicoccoides]
MERSRRLLLVAGLLAALLPAAAAAFGQQPGAPCEPTLLATQVALFCAPDMPTAQCCEPVVAAVDLGGGVPCLCRVAAEPQLVMAGLNATHLLTLYSSCGGLRPGGAHLAAACEGLAPPAAVVSSPPPPPPSTAPRRKQPAHDAPPPPPSSPPPSQEHDGAAPHAKAAPAQAATSPLAPAAAIAPPPQAPHSAAPTASSKAAFFFVATAMLGLYIIL